MFNGGVKKKGEKESQLVNKAKVLFNLKGQHDVSSVRI
jgi:hypothetical protein